MTIDDQSGCSTRRRKSCVRGCCGWLRTALRRALLDDDAAIDEQHAVGDVAGKAHLVGDDDHGHAVIGELAHHAEHVADQLGIERRGRLVEQDRLRLHRERARDRDALLLAAGELRRMRVGLVGEARPAPAARGRARAPRARGSFFT